MTWYNPKKTNEIPPSAARHLEREKRKARQRKLVRTEDPPLCVKEAAHILDVSESTVYRMLRDGRLTKAKIINRTRVLKSEVERYKRDQVDNQNSPAELIQAKLDNDTKRQHAIMARMVRCVREAREARAAAQRCGQTLEEYLRDELQEQPAPEPTYADDGVPGITYHQAHGLPRNPQ